MEAVPEAPDESAGNSSIVKSEDGSPSQDSGRSSPPPNCAICLGKCRNKSFTDSCLHQFCFKCLLTWSRVKTECPLCKQNFKSIIHNVKSNHQYEEYPVEQPHNEDRPPSLDELVNVARRFRYRTTLTLPRRETLAIQQFLMHYPLAALVSDMPPRAPSAAAVAARERERARRSPADFRRTVYRHNLWARPLPDFTGRFRDCTPEFFRYNDSQIHRLMPWLNRELHYLLNENSAHISYVMGRILELLPQHPIVSAEFRAAVHCYFGERTEHFLHEFHCFASTPYDLTGYDRHVQYQTDARASALVSEVLSSSDSDSRDSDIVVVSSSHAAAPAPAPAAAGPSREPAAVIPIETVSHSDSDSSEVMVVGYIKPPHQRTPELVDLLNSDSDVVVHDPERPSPAPSPAPAAAPAPTPAPLVRLTLSRARRPAPADTRASSDSDSSYTPPPPPRRRRRARYPPVPPAPPATPAAPAPTPPFSSDDESSYSNTAESSDSSSSYDGRRTRPARRKPRRKARAAPRREPRRRRDRSPRDSEERQPERSKRRKWKSKSEREDKPSRVESDEALATRANGEAGPGELATRAGYEAGPGELTTRAGYEAGPGGRASSEAGPSGLAPRKRKSDDRRPSRETKRLRSVVTVMKEWDSGSSRSHSASGSKERRSPSGSRWAPRAAAVSDRDSSDDNIPLHLAI